MTSTDLEFLRLKKLFFARFFVSLVLILVFKWLESPTVGDVPDPFLKQVFGLWLVFLAIQICLFYFSSMIVGNLLFQMVADLLLIGLLIFASGGIVSPFVFLLGVVIITAGTQARVLVVLVVAVLACITYLSAIYIHAAVHHISIADAYTLNILLQTSVLLLAGGIMAMIARRHADLQRQQRQVTVQHRRLQELHSHVLGAMQEGVVVLNEQFIVQDFNQATASMLGATAQHIGQALNGLLEIPSGMYDFIKQPHELAFRGESQHLGQPLLLTLTRLLEKESAWLLTIVNISEVRKLERQLAEQDKLASIGQMSAMLAHEIRNPMQTIAQAVELMALGNQPLNLERIVADEISRLNRLVSDMLDYAHPLHPHLQQVVIKTHIDESIQQVDLQNKHQVQTHVDAFKVNIDPDHFRLLLDNLLRNAIISSPAPASIHISCQQHHDCWELRIRDHGSGIAPEMRSKLFEPFKTGRKTGTGLGLATVAQVCASNGWLIDIDDDIDDGACFMVKAKMDGMMMGGEDNG
ncbi:MAG: ATP-binding protein [Ghiorsea sp.]